MSNQYVVSDGDAVNLQHLVAMCTDELFKKIMAAIHNQGR